MKYIKCTLVGDCVGKTAFIYSSAYNRFYAVYVPTVFDTHHTIVSFEDEQYLLNLSDTAAQEDYDRLRPLSFPRTDVFIMCFSVVEPSSFENIKEKWVRVRHHFCPNTPFLLVGTQVDLRDDVSTLERLQRYREEPISVEMGKRLAKKICAATYMECSAITQTGIKSVLFKAMSLVKRPREITTLKHGVKALKMLALGDRHIGKTSLLSSFAINKFSCDSIHNALDNYATTNVVGGKLYTLSLSDKAVRENYTNTDVFLLCFSVVSPSSIENAKKEWSQKIRRYCPHTPVLVVGTQADLRDDPETLEKLKNNRQTPVSVEMGEELANTLRAVKYVECSALTKKGLKNVFFEAVMAALEPPDLSFFPQPSQHDMTACQVVVVGDSGVGKTSLLLTYTTNKFTSEFTPPAFDMYAKTITCRDVFFDIHIILNLMDTKGKKIYDKYRPLSYPQTDVFLVCFSVVSPSSFKNISKKWVPEIKRHCKNTPFLLVGTQVDKRDGLDTSAKLMENKIEPITFEMGIKLAKKIGAANYVECSAVTKKNLEEVFYGVIRTKTGAEFPNPSEGRYGEILSNSTEYA